MKRGFVEGLAFSMGVEGEEGFGQMVVGGKAFEAEGATVARLQVC